MYKITLNTADKNEIVFTMGLPGAGKSTVCKGLFPTHTWIDPDAIKESHPEYDPKNPAELHAWSKKLADEHYTAALNGGGCYVLDGTGTNVEVLVKNIRKARDAGFTTRLAFVEVSLETALDRNSKRERVVPESIVREKAEAIYTAFGIASREVHGITRVNND